MDIPHILRSVEAEIKTHEERSYFWTHEERYRKILEQIEKIAHIAGPAARDSHDTLQFIREITATSPSPNYSLKSEETVAGYPRSRHPIASSEKKLRVLDVGCFPYHLGKALEVVGYELWGIASGHEPIQSDKIKICNIEKDKFPFKDNFFDLVVFTEVLEHLPQSPLFTIRQIHRVLKPGGHVILTTPNIARSINRAKLLLGKSVTYPMSQLLENNGNGSLIYHRHNREYTLSEVTRLLTLEHFTLVTAKTFVSYTPNRRRVVPDPLWIKAGKAANYALMMMVAGLRDTILVVGKK